LDIHEGNMEAATRLKAKLKALLKPMDAWPALIDRGLYLGKDIPIGGTAHQAGTLRFGADPAHPSSTLIARPMNWTTSM